MSGSWWTSWNFDPLVLIAVAGAAAAYAQGLRALGPRRRRWRRRSWAFGGGQVAVLAALVSPIDTHAGQLLSVHMVQHLLLVLVAAPLFVLGRPLVPVSLALSRRTRVWLRKAARTAPLAATGRIMCIPVVAWLLHVSVLWAWHAPGPYQAALGDPWLHALEHASFLGTAVLFWWVALADGAHRVLARGGDVLFVLAGWIQSGALGALFTFASAPIYPIYVSSAHLSVSASLHDQQVAGLVMWIPAGLVYLVAGTLLAARWLGSLERDLPGTDPAPELQPARTGTGP
jgi:cytochrome c oxidase assembly factor CtaG